MTTPSAAKAHLLVWALLAAIALLSACSSPTAPRHVVGVTCHTITDSLTVCS